MDAIPESGLIQQPASAGIGHGDGGAENGSSCGGTDWGDAYWTVGDAADRAGVPYVQLIEWIRRGELEVEVGGREGKEVRLVKAADLAALVPGLGSCPQDSPSFKGAGTPRTPGLEPPLPPLPEPAPHEPDPHEESSTEGSSAEPQLREELAEARARVAELSAESRALGAEVAQLQREVTNLKGRAPRLSAVQEPPQPVARPYVPQDRQGRGQALTSAAMAAVGLVLGAVFAGWMPGGSGEGVASAQDQARTVAAAQVPLGEWLPAVSARGEASVSGPGHAQDARTDSGGTIPSAELPEEAEPPRRTMPVARAIEASATRAMAIDADPEAGPGAGDPDTANSHTGDSGKRWLADILRVGASGGRPVGEALPCAYGALLDGVDPLAVGPCFAGVFLEDPAGGAGLALGTHRVEGVPCCAHHAFVERMTRASADGRALARITREAEASRADGVLPPLLRLRAERSASRFLKDALGARWFDAGLSSARGSGETSQGEHRWTLESAAQVQGERPSGAQLSGVRIRLRSWVVAREGEAPRSFELVMTLRSRAPGDLRESLRWIDGEPGR